MTSKIFRTTVEEDPATGDAIIKFPEEVMATLQWKEGDVVTVENGPNGEIFISKTKKPLDSSNEEKIFIVEANSNFFMRYAVYAKTKEEAEALVKQGADIDLYEIDQTHTGEIIVSTRSVTEEEFLNKESLGKDWETFPIEQKLKQIYKQKS